MMTENYSIGNHNPIGGYFELELPRHSEVHAEAIALNSGRLCLEYLLRCRKYKKVFIPYYTCDSVVAPLERQCVQYGFYHIDKLYRIVDDIHLASDEALLYTNYWGLQSNYCENLAAKFGSQLILDYTQAFYSKPIFGIDSFYSCRKYFGVPDGGYLYTDSKADLDIEQDESYMRMTSLTKRIDISAEAGYEDFHKTEVVVGKMPIRRMSKLTKRMMQSIDYERVAQQRIDNYNTLRNAFGGRALHYGEVPMIFPYESIKGQDLRKHLIANKIFVAKYWPNVDEWTEKSSVERWMANHILPLPIDQRYDKEDMNRIVEIIHNYE